MHKIMALVRGVRIEAALGAGMFAWLWLLAILFRIDATHISYAAHFVVQDQSWLSGRFDVPAWLGHDLVHIGGKQYIVYPPAPALLMLPFVALLGGGFSDIWFGWLVAAANVALLYRLLSVLVARGWSKRSPRENAIIAATFGLGTIALWLALGGTVWFLAQTLAITFTLLLLMGALRANWWLASAALGMLFLTRSPDVIGGFIMFACFFAANAKAAKPREEHASAVDGAVVDMAQTLPMPARQRSLHATLAPPKNTPRFSVPSVFASMRHVRVREILALTLPLVLAVIVWLARNKLYFGGFLNSGYGLQVQQDYPQIRHGLLSWRYVWPNFVANFLNLPAFTFRSPYDLAPKVDLLRAGNGTSIFFTTPLFLLFFAAARSRLPRWLRLALWTTVGLLIAVTLLWNLTGWYQVGARYLFDMYPYLFVLLAARGGRIGVRWLALAGGGALVNLALAQVFWCHDSACFAGSPHRLELYTVLLALIPLLYLAAWWWLRNEAATSPSPQLVGGKEDKEDGNAE